MKATGLKPTETVFANFQLRQWSAAMLTPHICTAPYKVLKASANSIHSLNLCSVQGINMPGIFFKSLV